MAAHQQVNKKHEDKYLPFGSNFSSGFWRRIYVAVFGQCIRYFTFQMLDHKFMLLQ